MSLVVSINLAIRRCNSGGNCSRGIVNESSNDGSGTDFTSVGIGGSLMSWLAKVMRRQCLLRSLPETPLLAPPEVVTLPPGLRGLSLAERDSRVFPSTVQ